MAADSPNGGAARTGPGAPSPADMADFLAILNAEEDLAELEGLYEDYDTGGTVPIMTPLNPGEAALAAMAPGFIPNPADLALEDAALAELEGLYDDYDTGS